MTSVDDNSVPSILDVKDLTVLYGRLPAVKSVSLSVKAGEIVGLIGPNGAGKSSLLLAISGELPCGGTIKLSGKDIRGRPPESIVREGVALVPEGRRIFGTLTVEENLKLGMTPRRKPFNPETEILDMLARFPDLRNLRHRAGVKLSGGEQQQLAIARALLSHPRLLLLDEPSLGLAPRVVDAVFDAIVGLRQTGVTILLVEQNAYRALEVANRVYVMNTGRIRNEGTPSELMKSGDFVSTYLGVA